MRVTDIERLAQRSIRKLDDEAAFEHIGTLIDLSADASYKRGADRALYLLDELATRDLTATQRALIHYYRANAWSLKSHLAGHHQSWTWEQPETQEEILELSRAAAHEGFDALGKIRQCQILTNLGNLLNGVGRFVDALEKWDQALALIPRFAMARGNRGSGLRHYAGAHYDQGHRAVFLVHAYDAFVSATAPDAIYDAEYPDSVAEGFREHAADIAANASIEEIRANVNLHDYSLGRGKAEQRYRRWCLEQRLFLNPLNDLGPYPIAAQDVLMLPSLTVDMRAASRPASDTGMPPIIGFYNQMKQEFASARYMLFEGLNATGVHFSDRDVLLYNTLDFPSYSLGVERVRASYRIAYSLLDKVAFLINEYFELGRDLERVNFKNVWLDDGKRSKPLDSRFATYDNWPLRGLFWLSKEIFDEQLKRTTNPDARELHDIRNHLEHKYLQVHEGWAASVLAQRLAPGSLGLSISSDRFEAKATRVLKIARSALIYLPLAIRHEERSRERNRDPSGLIAPMPLSEWEDAWKRSR